MNKKQADKLKPELEEIALAFNKILEERGFGEIRVQNFKLTENLPRACQEYKLVYRSDGTAYWKCVRP